MQELVINGGRSLHGEAAIAGSKNAALPLMAAAILNPRGVSLERLAHLSDIFFMGDLLRSLGGEVSLIESRGYDARTTSPMRAAIRFGDDYNPIADYDLVRKMRAGILVLGPLLGRYGRAEVSLPGGCAIGTRPVDLHLQGLRALGAEIDMDGGYIKASAKSKSGLRGAYYRFPSVSVGATENVLMAAVLARGETILDNVATEPEITALAEALVAMGARIDGIGSETLTVQGVTSLHAGEHRIIADRIECGTLAIATVACGGDVTLTDAEPHHLGALWEALRRTGATIDLTSTTCRIRMQDRPTALDITTAPYPGFATDLQAQMAAMLCLARGTSHIYETIFENRFMHVSELMRLQADIAISGNACIINGKESLKAAPLMASDLRASASLIIAALAAEGTAHISRIYHLDRGYEFPERKLSALGASIKRIG